MSDPVWGKWGSWEDAESCVGKVVGVTTAPDAVELGAIRRWLEPKEFDCALHTDKSAAQSAGYRDIIAPNINGVYLWNWPILGAGGWHVRAGI